MKGNKFITKEITEAVLWVNTLFRGKVTFCGSFGLVMHNILERPIHDIDCITDTNWYGKPFWDEIGQWGYTQASNSEKFTVNGVLVMVFKLTAPNGIGIDVMYREDGVKSNLAYLDGWEIKVEVPESAIDIKQNYLKILGRNSNLESAAKHQADLKYIQTVTEVQRISAINKEIDNAKEEVDDFQNGLDF